LAGETNESAWILEAKLTVPGHVIYRWFEEETVLLNLDTGQYHGLNETGGRMLQLLDETDGAVRPAVQRLAGEYEMPYEEIAPLLANFCTALADRGLVEVEADGRSRAAG
jgi:hypothetical protein